MTIPTHGLRRRVTDYCRQRLATVLPPRDLDAFQAYLVSLVDEARRPPRVRLTPNWDVIASAAGLDVAHLRASANALKPVLDAIDRAFKDVPIEQENQAGGGPAATRDRSKKAARKAPSSAIAASLPKRPKIRPGGCADSPRSGQPRTAEKSRFAAELDAQMRNFGDSAPSLVSALATDDDAVDPATLRSWRRGAKSPRSIESLAVLSRIEDRYALPAGHFCAMLPNPSRATMGHHMPEIGVSERRRLAWHLPHDFNRRPPAEREEILAWVRTVVISGSTDYRRYQAAASKTPFGLRFPGLLGAGRSRTDPSSHARRSRLAPPGLHQEMERLVEFKTATLTAIGYQRSGVWGDETAAQKVEHLSLLFGALSAGGTGPVRGADIPPEQLTFSMLIVPKIWDWYLAWRADRRGFYTQWEVEMLNVAVALTRRGTGWLRQSPELAARLTEVPGLITADDVRAATEDWSGCCDKLYDYALARSKEVGRVSKVHRDPFEPILAVLEADSPLGEYRKIADEILRLMPDERSSPLAAAEAVRSYLLIRLGLHLGLRQKNLRQLLVCPRGQRPRSERTLEDLKRGEIRWNEKDAGWEVLIPAVAFKNAHSSFFGKKPFRLVLPDLAGLNAMIDAWVERHRSCVLGRARDPETFFVKTVKTTSKDASYNQTTFYEAWRLTIQRYGVYNPYTGRGAIEGLLPHGPHNIRDVLATHILKMTGSYEQASYAIQDTPETVAAHYGRFLPQDKAALAAQILNQVWLTAD